MTNHLKEAEERLAVERATRLQAIDAQEEREASALRFGGGELPETRRAWFRGQRDAVQQWHAERLAELRATLTGGTCPAEDWPDAAA